MTIKEISEKPLKPLKRISPSRFFSMRQCSLKEIDRSELRILTEEIMQVCRAAAPMSDDKNGVRRQFNFIDCTRVNKSFELIKGKSRQN